MHTCRDEYGICELEFFYFEISVCVCVHLCVSSYFRRQSNRIKWINSLWKWNSCNKYHKIEKKKQRKKRKERHYMSNVCTVNCFVKHLFGFSNYTELYLCLYGFKIIFCITHNTFIVCVFSSQHFRCDSIFASFYFWFVLVMPIATCHRCFRNSFAKFSVCWASFHEPWKMTNKKVWN